MTEVKPLLSSGSTIRKNSPGASPAPKPESTNQTCLLEASGEGDQLLRRFPRTRQKLQVRV